jgi:hypothetical protein
LNFDSNFRQIFLHPENKIDKDEDEDGDKENDGTDDLIQIGGTDITIQGEPGAVLDGNGPAWWDGLGSNGGVKKYSKVHVSEGQQGY